MIHHDNADGSWAEHTTFYPCGVCRAQQDMAASLERSHADMLAGRVLPWRVVELNLPRPIVWVPFHWVSPWTWGRKVKRLADRGTEKQEEA